MCWRYAMIDAFKDAGHIVSVFDIREPSLPLGFDFHLDIDSAENHYIKYPNNKTIYWAFDAFQDYSEDKFLRMDFYKERCMKADIVLSASSHTQQNLKKIGIQSEVVMAGYIPYILEKDLRYMDITYIGNSWWFPESVDGVVNRTDYYLNLLIEHFPNQVNKLKGIPYKDCYYIYNKSKMVFNHTTVAANHLSNRVFEALYTGALLLTNKVNDLALLGLEDNVNYVSYDNPEELVGLIHLMLESPELREEIAGAGKNKILEAQVSCYDIVDKICKLI